MLFNIDNMCCGKMITSENLFKTGRQIIEGTLKELGIVKIDEGLKQLAVVRMNICIGCPGDHYNKVEKKCTLCTCKMSRKVLVRDAVCPEQYW